MKPNFCLDGGYLVCNEWLPTQPFDFHWPTTAPIIGCSHVKCSNCGAEVRQLFGRNAPENAHAKTLYNGIASLPKAELSIRVYACLCRYENVRVFKRADQGVEEFVGDASESSWGCAGHPRLVLPTTLDDTLLSASTNWTQLVLRVFSRQLVQPLHPSVDDIPGFWVQRLYALLSDTPWAAHIEAAVADLLEAEDAHLQLCALRFFAAHWLAPSAARVAVVFRDRPHVFDVADPSDPDQTLRARAIETLTWRMGNNDPLALTVLKAEMLRAPVPSMLMHHLADDAAWFVAHAEEILRASPNEWDTVLYLLARRRVGVDEREALLRLALSINAATPAEVRKFLERSFTDSAREELIKRLGV